MKAKVKYYEDDSSRLAGSVIWQTSISISFLEHSRAMELKKKFPPFM